MKKVLFVLAFAMGLSAQAGNPMYVLVAECNGTVDTEKVSFNFYQVANSNTGIVIQNIGFQFVSAADYAFSNDKITVGMYGVITPDNLFSTLELPLPSDTDEPAPVKVDIRRKSGLLLGTFVCQVISRRY